MMFPAQSFILQRGRSETRKREADDFLFANSDSAGWKMFACGAASAPAVLNLMKVPASVKPSPFPLEWCLFASL